MPGLHLLDQFWIHATRIPKPGPPEWVLNTPSHHRVHHARHAAYLDCNDGGVPIVFDRLFGTFVAEREDLPPVYGLTTPLHSHDPFRTAFHGWLRAGPRPAGGALAAGPAAHLLRPTPGATVPRLGGSRHAAREDP